MRPSEDEGAALVEFTWLAVLLMVPLVYGLLSVFAVQRTAFGVTEAARQAGRAYATAPDTGAGLQRAQLASDLALGDQGAVADGPVQVQDPAGLAPGGTVRVTVRATVTLPVLGVLLPSSISPRIPVQATHTEVVDVFQAVR